MKTLEERLARIPIFRTLGFRIGGVNEGSATLIARCDPRYDGVFQSFHGGLRTTLAKTAAWIAVLASAGADAEITTTALTIGFFGALPARLHREASIIKIGKNALPAISDTLEFEVVRRDFGGILMNLVKTRDEQAVSRVHHELIQTLVDTGNCPTRSELAGRLEMPVAQIEELLAELSELHGVVLHPHICEPWLVHPFSTTPTAHWVEGEDASWWAPCIWCALGIATLVGGETRIHTRVGAESEPLVIRVIQGQPVGLEDVWVHFAIPPARAWQNVHQHCSMVLAFRSREDILAWCNRHRLPHGEHVPLHQVARFAQLWYGTHADTNWHKWTIAEAQAIFERSGFVSPFWDLGQKEGRY